MKSCDWWLKEADGDAPEKIAEVTKKFRHFVDHLRVANTVIGRDQLSKNV